MEPNEIFELIKAQHTEDYVIEQFEDKIPDYLDSDWENDFEDEDSAYKEQGRGEAEGDVIREMIGWYTDTHNNGQKLETSVFIEVFDLIKNHYDCLNNA